MLPEFSIMEYCVALVRFLLSVMVRVFPLIVFVMGMYVPCLMSFTPIASVPGLIVSLKVTFIILLIGTFTALFVGFTLFMVGALLSVVKLVTFPVTLAAYILPEINIIILKTRNIVIITLFVILPPPN